MTDSLAPGRDPRHQAVRLGRPEHLHAYSAGGDYPVYVLAMDDRGNATTRFGVAHITR